MAASVVPPVRCTRAVMSAGRDQVPAVPLAPAIRTSRSRIAVAASEAAVTDVPPAVNPDDVTSTGLVACTPRYTARATVLAILPVNETVTDASPATTVRR